MDDIFILSWLAWLAGCLLAWLLARLLARSLACLKHDLCTHIWLQPTKQASKNDLCLITRWLLAVGKSYSNIFLFQHMQAPHLGLHA